MSTPVIATKWVYDFHEGSRELRNLLGGKGSGVAEMTRILGPGLVPIEGRIVPLYADLGILERSPFGSLDTDGAGELISIALARGRAAQAAVGRAQHEDKGTTP